MLPNYVYVCFAVNVKYTKYSICNQQFSISLSVLIYAICNATLEFRFFPN